MERDGRGLSQSVAGTAMRTHASWRPDHPQAQRPHPDQPRERPPLPAPAATPRAPGRTRGRAAPAGGVVRARAIRRSASGRASQAQARITVLPTKGRRGSQRETELGSAAAASPTPRRSHSAPHQRLNPSGRRSEEPQPTRAPASGLPSGVVFREIVCVNSPNGNSLHFRDTGPMVHHQFGQLLAVDKNQTIL